MGVQRTVVVASAGRSGWRGCLFECESLGEAVRVVAEGGVPGRVLGSGVTPCSELPALCVGLLVLRAGWLDVHEVRHGRRGVKRFRPGPRVVLGGVG